MVGTMNVHVLCCVVIRTSTPAVLNKPKELATVTMWPWFSSSILGRNALVVCGWVRAGAGGAQRTVENQVSSLVPKPFDHPFFPLLTSPW